MSVFSVRTWGSWPPCSWVMITLASWLNGWWTVSWCAMRSQDTPTGEWRLCVLSCVSGNVQRLVGRSVGQSGQSTTLARTEISQQLSDEFIHGPQRMSPTFICNPLTFPPSMRSTFVVQCEIAHIIYYMDCHEITLTVPGFILMTLMILWLFL